MTENVKSTYSLRDLPDMVKVVEIKLALGEFEQMTSQELGRYAKKVRTKGFRPGHTPLRMVANQYGAEIKEEVRERLLNKLFRRAIAENSLSPDGQVQSRVKEVAGDKHAGVYEISFETLPEFDPGSIAGLKCALVKGSADQGDTDEALADLQKRHIKWQESTLASANGHRVSFAYTMTVEGKPFQPGGEEQMRMELVLGEKHLLAELPEKLFGVRPGDHRRIEAKFPENFSGTELAGKTAVLETDIEKVCTPVFPDLDDDFARQADPGSGTMERLTENIRKFLTHEAERLARTLNRTRIRDLLLANFELPLPPEMVKHSTQKFIESLNNPATQNNPRQAPVNKADAEKRVRQDMTLGVIFSALARHHRCTASAERVGELVKADAQISKNPRAAWRKIMKTPDERRHYENIVIEEMIFEHIFKAIDGGYEQTSLRELRLLSAQPPAPTTATPAQSAPAAIPAPASASTPTPAPNDASA
ncbi:MAG: trigger factor [Gammaproteobacteria bacterium]|nr:trigger factor [Pseudomonadota bacterium]MCH9662913.1 trigger factor [Gammaproteobacteria bacterium]